MASKINKYNAGKVTWDRMPTPVCCQIANSSATVDVEVWSCALRKWIAVGYNRDFFPKSAYRIRPPKKVFVHVRGGVAYCDRVPKGVVVKIIDHDNKGHK